jgi:hypothetical protein
MGITPSLLKFDSKIVSELPSILNELLGKSTSTDRGMGLIQYSQTSRHRAPIFGGYAPCLWHMSRELIVDERVWNFVF